MSYVLAEGQKKPTEGKGAENGIGSPSHPNIPGMPCPVRRSPTPGKNTKWNELQGESRALFGPLSSTTNPHSRKLERLIVNLHCLDFASRDSPHCLCFERVVITLCA
ncbi:hypothetical protein J6590_031914 [Homalodisca vitripennis]|nr:hypothetical protein J6590_031914 [Homalodisca vitripennis]